MTDEWFVLVESNTTGSGRLFCACAREIGARPVVLARDPSRYLYIGTDQIDSRCVDTADVESIRAVCTALPGRVVGVTSSSEYFIAPANEVARALDLPHTDPDAIRACRDKRVQRERLAAAGVPGPAFAAAGTPESAVQAAAGVGLPVVVKPIAGSGSIGTQLCARLEDVHRMTEAVLGGLTGLPPQDAVMVEEYVEGAEYSVETLDEHVVGVTRKHLGPPPYFVETGHDFPAALTTDERTSLSETAIAALRALGLGWGAAHVELRQSATGPLIVEVNPRLAGGMIPRMVHEAYGLDMIAYVVAKAAGIAKSAQPTRHRAASIRFLVATAPGRLVEITGAAAARALPGVVEVGLTASPGQDVAIHHSFQDRLGYVIASGEGGAAAAQAADNGVRMLTIHLRKETSVNGSS